MATVKELVAGEWRLDLNPKTRHGQTPLHLAAAHGHGTLVQAAPPTMSVLSSRSVLSRRSVHALHGTLVQVVEVHGLRPMP